MKCSYCNAESKKMFKIKDGIICEECLNGYPRCMRDYINRYQLETLRKIDQTQIFKSLTYHNVDFEILKFGEAAITNYYLKFSDVLIPLNRIASVNVFFRPLSQQKGFLHSLNKKYVYGYVSMKITTTYPRLELQDVIGETTAIQTAPNHYNLNEECLVIGRKLRNIIDLREESERQNKTLVEAKKNEQRAINMYLREKERAEYAEKRLRETVKGGSNEVYDAMTLFMLEKPYTQEDVRKQRNRLMKSFHPDGNDISEVYAQKINNAYNILLKSC